MHRVEWIAAAVVFVCLLALAVLASRRWGPPRSSVAMAHVAFSVQAKAASLGSP